MEDPRRAYLVGAMGTAAARGLTLVAGFASLWLLTRLLDERELAGFLVATSIVTILGYVAGLGLERSMLLRLPALHPGPGRLAGRTLAGQTSAVVAAIAVAVAALLYLSAGFLEAEGSSVSAAWIRMLAPVVPATALSLTLMTWFQANHRVALPQLAQGLSDALRAALFGLCLVLGLGAAGVAGSSVLAAGLPLALLALAAVGRTAPDAERLRLGDWAPGAQFLVSRVSYLVIRHLDIVLLGLLAGPAETAGYAIASRIAGIVGVSQELFTETYLPRSRRHHETGGRAAVEREFRASRAFAFALALATAAAFAAAGPLVLELFGDFGPAYGPLLVLMAGHVASAGSGNHGAHLSMAGHLRWSMTTQIAATATFLATALIWIPEHGALGAAFAFLASAIVAGGVGTALLVRLTGLDVLGPRVVLPVAASLAILAIGPWLADAAPAAPVVVPALLAAVLAVHVVIERQVFASALRPPRAAG